MKSSELTYRIVSLKKGVLSIISDKLAAKALWALEKNEMKMDETCKKKEIKYRSAVSQSRAAVRCLKKKMKKKTIFFPFVSLAK